jgi:hypothetical protein
MRDAPLLKQVPDNLYFREMKKEIDTLLERSTTYILCNEEDAEQIYSYAVIERLQGDLVIHFAYTKSFFWKMGLMKKLLLSIEPNIQAVGATITFFAPSFQDEKFSVNGRSFWLHLRDKYKLVYNPFVKGLM